MRNDKLSVQSLDFAAAIMDLVKQLKENKEFNAACTSLRAMLVASINTAKENGL